MARLQRPFLKMHGLGNDFVVFDGREDGFIPTEQECQKIANRHRGIGCDQIIILAPPEAPEAHLFMHMRNADGSLVRACGNASRCVARLIFEETGRKEAIIQTVAGLLRVWQEGENLYAVDFGKPHLSWDEIPLLTPTDTLYVPIALGDLADPCCVSMGNPHAVFFVEDVESVTLDLLGPQLETHPMFPDRANIEIAEIIDHQTIRMRVWERGTGITEACGSGASATLVAAVRRGLTDRRATIILDGGKLTIEWRREDDHVILMGPASLSYKGALVLED